ncbi:Dbl homology domain-containing protein [Fistulina hepatica ATCC 64428]|uniref:Dbl homology domain-containing protein n=1 Tax=Fistulina hepatica ATCC 64428 TaxID=1128425 RepID=A0A0D7AHY5_9AGAR|nr:Dbl homology domain-containing protein [Fistulina hepatica ATCC 64428]
MLRELAGDAPPRELIQPGSRFSIDSSPSGEAYRENGYQTDDRDRDDNYRVYDEEEYFDDPALDAASFVNYALLSHVAVQLRDRVSRSTHVQSGVRYPNSFSGKDIVTTIHALVQANLMEQGLPPDDRRVALQVARSLQSQLFFYEVEWGFRVLQDDAKAEDVYMFLDDDGEAGPSTSASGGRVEQEELPSGVMPVLARCYTPFCGEVVDGRTPGPCYAWDCPRKVCQFYIRHRLISGLMTTDSAPEAAGNGDTDTWLGDVDPAVLRRLPDAERNRQTIIHKIISKEAAYVQDMDTVIEYFIKPLQAALTSSPAASTFSTSILKDVFSNLSELRACHARLLDILHVRQRVLTRKISQLATEADIFLEAAAGFREVYPAYVGNHPIAERRLREATEASPSLRLFLEQCARKAATRASGGENADSHKPQLDLKHLLNRPLEHLQKYPVLLEAIYQGGNPDAEFLLEAVTAIRDLHTAAQLRTFQAAMGRGTPGKWEWHDLVAPEVMQLMEKHERKRQAIMFEVIKGEMAYVKDLENIRIMYIEPLYAANPPIVPTARLDAFVDDVFHNYAELFVHHRTLLTRLHEIQREQHPTLRSITAPLYDAVLQFREAYIEYIPNYPIAAYRIDDETATNPAFKEFVEACVRHPDAHRLDMRNFINRPIPRLLRYELLLKGILEETPKEDPERPDLREIAKDRRDIPEVLDLIKALGKETEPGVVSAKQKVQLWTYNTHLVFKAGESGMTSVHDLDLLDPNRSLIHSGKLVRQPDSGLEWSGWPELFVILFDNYLVLTKAKERDGVTKYQVYRRPIPLDLLTIVNFTDPPTQRSTGLLRNLRGGERHETPASGAPESASDARAAYPCTIHHTGRLGGTYVLYAESAQARAEWKQKLEEALGIRRVVQESNKVFEVETLSVDTFLIPSLNVGSAAPAYNQDNMFTGKVTCSVPFNTIDGRGLVAVGCAEGVWIGFRHDPKSMRRVLHLKMVTQCAILNEFGIFLVLADKALFAYHIEALVPTAQTSHTSQAPQKLNGAGGVQFFRVGKFQGRTLVIYMKKKGLESIFRVLEPVSEQINARTRAPTSLGSRLGFRSGKSEWFRIYRVRLLYWPFKDFFLPSESFDLIFLKAKIVILCTKGFEIMDIDSFQSVTIPQREDPRMVPLAKRCESSRPLGMFRSGKDEFLLCYDEFGLYVDKHGDPSRPAMAIEWEGTAQDVALHEPYVLLFDSRFIEVRHLETGRLCQIISGTEMRCIWDGRGADDLATQAPGAFQEARVHGVMSASDSTSPPSRGMSRPIAQQVFELLPTTPLSALGQSQSPSQSYIQSVDNSDPSTSRSSSWRS